MPLKRKGYERPYKVGNIIFIKRDFYYDVYTIASFNKWAAPSEKGAYGFSNIMQANDVDDVIYDVTIGNIQHATQTFL